jgi:hypothetical protein
MPASENPQGVEVVFLVIVRVIISLGMMWLHVLHIEKFQSVAYYSYDKCPNTYHPFDTIILQT